MADVLCPVCGKPNPEELEECQFCGSLIRKPPAAPLEDSQPIKPGEEPVRKVTSDLERVNLGGGTPIHPGDSPTRKNTAELERALPSWLQSLRKEPAPGEGESLAEPTADESSPAGAASPASSNDSMDWLSGLSAAASEEEEQVPDWLAGLRDANAAEAETDAQEEEETAGPPLDASDWMARLGGESAQAAAETPASPSAPLPDQVDFEGFSTPAPASDTPDWLKDLQAQSSDARESPTSSIGGEAGIIPDWLSGLPGISAESSPDLTAAPAPDENETFAAPGPTPDWLADLPAQESASLEPSQASPEAEYTSDWLPPSIDATRIPAAAPGENLPAWLSNLEGLSGSEFGTPAAFIGDEALPADDLSTGTPDWLSRLQAGAKAAHPGEPDKNDLGAGSGAPAASAGSGPLPDWLTQFDSSPQPSVNAPALIPETPEKAPGGRSASPFSMETPDWLTQLNPEQALEETTEGSESQTDSSSLESAELPSWVQAMRPVESVVESKSASRNESQVTEQSGPLAGLRGVLPALPGLGKLRKPPVYSAKTLVSDSQQRYATYLEQLVAGEGSPRVASKPQLASNRVSRWLITLLLFLAVGLPLTFKAQVVAPTLLESSDKFASSNIVDGLAANAPVLVAFDYDPAFSGEMETVAAPLVEQLLSKGIPLALVSTSPTGPVLAQHFLQNAPLINMHKLTSGEQFINLGYLPGGPAGLSYFSNSPTLAMPFTLDGKPAWATGPFQSIQYLSDFAAILVLTENADTGRDWVEQVAPHIGNTPMLMMISAQAGPMIRPYFDSGQIKGMVVGLSDAKIYEQHYNLPGQANRYWDSFKIGMLIAELILVIGAVYGFWMERRARAKASKGAA